MQELYLDANAHITMSKNVLKKYCEYHSSIGGYGHPLSPSKPGQQAASALETARGKIAYLLGAEKPSQIVFTSTCTQACEWGLNILKNIIKDKTLTYLPVEHAAVRLAIEKLNIKKQKFNIENNGTLINNKKYNYVSCMHVQNEIGTIYPIENINCDFIFSDMCQSPGKVSINLKNMNIDIATFGAHKFGGPASIGFLYIKDPNIWTEFGTGSRYFNDRPGTPDVASVVATAEALEETLLKMPERLYNMKVFQKITEEYFLNNNYDVIGLGSNRVPNTSFIKLEGIGFNVLAELTNKNIHVGMGSACGSMHTGVSLIMKSLGLPGEGHDFIRISQHGDYGKKEAEYFVNEINKIIKYYK